jgi:hypothetical protein
MSKSENRNARQEMVQVIYRFRSEYYVQQDREKHCRRRGKQAEAVGNREQAEAYWQEADRRNKLADFLIGEIRVLKQALDQFDAAA